MHQPASPVSQEMMDRLHRATEHFHECKARWEQVLIGSDYRHGERVAAAQEELGKAEREVEEAEAEISRAMSSSSPKASAAESERH